MKSKNIFIRQVLFFFLAAGNIMIVLSQSSSLKEISGYVTHDKIPLKNVNVYVQDANQKVVTDGKGFYSIEAGERDVIQYSFIGMRPVAIMVEDVTDFLNIKMSKKVSDLDEVLVQGNGNEKNFIRKKRRRPKVSIAYGKIDKRSFSNRAQIIEGKDLWLGSRNVTEAIQNQLAFAGYASLGIRPTGTIFGKTTPIYDIDGIIFNDNPPHVDLYDVDFVAILRSVGATTLYGMRGAAGVIVVRTKGASKTGEVEDLAYTNRSKYKYDALPYKYTTSRSKYLDNFKSVADRELYNTYQRMVTNYKSSPSFYLDVADFFRKEKKNKKLALKVLKDMQEEFDKNPEALKALAYTYEHFGEKKQAIEVYYRIAYLRASYTQSFRDLANAYTKNKQYKEGWDMYLRYLQRGNKLKEKGIEQMVYNEMHSLYSQKKDIAKIKETFIPKSNKEDLESDLRVVFEWNTSEAEFAFEFVDPNLNAFTYEHSLSKNSERIADQKAKGYSSEEFFVHDMKNGNWLINMTYLGNKKYQPTYLKATVYKNWGRKNQTQEIKVFKLSDLGNKTQLFTFNSAISTAISSNLKPGKD